MSSIVAIDIETTGLDSQRDVIIEIAAVRFNGHRIEDEWSSLINPNRHIPDNITQLTGIDDQMVRHAPRLADVINDFAEFVAEAPVLGHNVRFDMGFLQKQRVLAYNDVIDTYELASVLLPTASRYNLAALGQLLGVPLPATHRALDDTRVTQSVYLRLYDLASELPTELLEEIIYHGEGLDWDGNWFFRHILSARSKTPMKAKQVRAAEKKKKAAPLFDLQDEEDAPPLKPVDTPIELDPDEVAAALEYGGPFSKYFNAYEQRPEQVEMLRAVAKSLSYGNHLMVEAGTGVGKSFAYLVPAAYFAIQNNTRVVVSTNTINLQDQLINKDIPDLAAALKLDGSDKRNTKLRAALLKGRNNYLCPRRVDIMRQQGPKDADEMRVLAKVLVWLQENISGDRNEINLNRPAEKIIWSRLSAEDDACTTETCLSRESGACPFHQAKQAALHAHILIVNHALLLADVATGSKVLPEYQYLIVDEAHHLESATTNALSFRVQQNDLERLTREAGGPTAGTLGLLLTNAHDILKPSDFAKLSQLVHRASDLSFRLESQVKDFFYGLNEFMSMQREGKPPSNYAIQERVLPATRTAPGWDNVELAWSAAGETLRLLINCTGDIYRATAELYADGHDNLEDAMGNLSTLLRRLSETELNISALIHKPTADKVYWIETQQSGNRLSLNAAPVRVGALVQEHLWNQKNAVILTSATLTANGDFNYVRNVLNAVDVDTLNLGSPFDYANSTLLFIPKDIPEPNAPGYEAAVNRGLIQLCAASEGRVLVLFTSYAQLKRCSQAISRPLRDKDIQVYEQGEGASANALLDAFKSNGRSVLLGTRSFWEGVDVPGEALSVVVITKLPFDVPSDPIIAARSETFEDPFGEYHIPEAILRFRQGFGRLIRSASDRGVVAIFDRRVVTKQYGAMFINSLPECTLQQSTLADLPKLAARWLGL